MAEYKVTDTSLTSVANAIRTKGNTSSILSFPDGFVSAIQNIPTGEQPTLITKTVSLNGIYTAASDNADGYSAVTVNVPGLPYVTGTFTGQNSDKSGIITVSIPYFGNGYPVALQIFPTAGTYKSGTDMYNLAQKKILVLYSMAKADPLAIPTYADDTEKNWCSAIVLYKYSDTDSTSMSTAQGKNTRIYSTMNPVGSYSINSVKFYNNSTMKVWIATTDEYGFAPEIEYTYQIIYSA